MSDAWLRTDLAGSWHWGDGDGLRKRIAASPRGTTALLGNL